MRTVIIDDEPECIKTLSEDLKQYKSIELIDTASDYDNGKELIERENPDVIFIDIELYEKSGIDLLDDVKDEIDPNTKVVFYSAFDRYMIDAIRMSAFDFLLKPYIPSELEIVVKRLQESRKEIRVAEEGRKIFRESIAKLKCPNAKILAIQTITGIAFVDANMIVGARFDAGDKCWVLYMTDKNEFKLRSSTNADGILKLKSTLVLVNKSDILNFEYICSIENKSLRCILLPPYEDTEIYASRRCYAKLKEQLQLL